MKDTVEDALGPGRQVRAVAPRAGTTRRHVRILMCTRDGAPFLGAQLRSLLDQTHPDWSLWVADDGSRDATPAILRDFQAAQGERVRLFEGPGRGAAANFLTLAARTAEEPGAWLAFADQDDVWMPHRLARGLEAASRAAAPAVVHAGATILTDAALRPRGASPRHRRAPGFGNALVQNILGGNTILLDPGAAALLRATCTAACPAAGAAQVADTGRGVEPGAGPGVGRGAGPDLGRGERPGAGRGEGQETGSDAGPGAAWGAKVAAMAQPSDAAAPVLPGLGVPFHDWWIYLVMSGCGARILIDPAPGVFYRQHGRNLLGTSLGLRNAAARLGMVRSGRYAAWIDANLAALQTVEAMLTPENRARLQAVLDLRAAAPGWRGAGARMRALRAAGLYRQTPAGDLMLQALALSGRL